LAFEPIPDRTRFASASVRRARHFTSATFSFDDGEVAPSNYRCKSRLHSITPTIFEFPASNDAGTRMDSPAALRIARVLRATLQCVEDSGLASPDSSELIHLKQHVVRAVSELEIQKSPPELGPAELEVPVELEPERPPVIEPEKPIVILRMR
jgi:hypothetical protein